MSEIESSGEILRREFPAEVSASGDGRTLDVRIVPYGEVARVSDPPDFVPYEETWVPGAFDKQLSAANRVSVFVNVEHEEGIKGIVGRGTELREVPGDGLHGTFRMLNHPDADKALELVNEGDLTGVSLEFKALKSVRENGLVKRVKARLVNIALVRPSGSPGGIQAYKSAGVLAVRETPEVTVTASGTTVTSNTVTGTMTSNTVTGTNDGVPVTTVTTTATREVPTEPEPEEPAPEEPAPEPTPEPEPERTAAVSEALTRIGYESETLKRAVTTKPWDGSPARFTDDEYQRSALFCRAGDDPPKTRCSLPVLEPNGDLNANALGAAAGRLNQTAATPAEKAAAARKLMRLYRMANMTPPPALMAIAGRA